MQNLVIAEQVLHNTCNRNHSGQYPVTQNEASQKVCLIISQGKPYYCFCHIFSLTVLEINIFLFTSPAGKKNKKKKFVFNFLVSVGKQSHDKKDKQEPHT